MSLPPSDGSASLEAVFQDVKNLKDSFNQLLQALSYATDRIEQNEEKTRSVEDNVDEQLEELSGHVLDLQTQIISLAPQSTNSAQNASAANSAGDEGQFSAEPWATTATSHDWEELVRWVDWLRSTYDVIEGRAVPACWPAHPGLVEELAALREAWAHACKQRALEGDGQALAHWHERYLTPLFSRINTYRIKSCDDYQHTMPSPRPDTRTDLLPPIN
ncbi:hypothetical protein GZ176_11760 [Dermatophilus congolensis]|uniref:hypothetical protein n=1 Tax=Dermatophilus congolensis TaxID=1863 RepID=UPI001AAE2C1E|nr:hypothetical protein [Dermatophilus congolensis]MBO3146358.1 hypothetical protein [Dermatophilus congolensis]MBO3148599.1 hypothetical protein [Dermatophilus congolensis]MBO3157595.1 hypothetical protein [Dermatophilus congolensis]MBO3159875.1 hypothetical protein [Dermatophilus congolensis]MBO3166614.1 hypothetical protein [Dermatophilus congolensis]